MHIPFILANKDLSCRYLKQVINVFNCVMVKIFSFGETFASLNETFYFSIDKNVFYHWTHKYCINYYLLTKREVCTIVKYRTDVFRTDRTSAVVRGPCRKAEVRYFTSTDRTSKVNK